jgi:hypothetical protein
MGGWRFGGEGFSEEQIRGLVWEWAGGRLGDLEMGFEDLKI